jgi:hypothetical protein
MLAATRTETAWPKPNWNMTLSAHAGHASLPSIGTNGCWRSDLETATVMVRATAIAVASDRAD